MGIVAELVFFKKSIYLFDFKSRDGMVCLNFDIFSKIFHLTNSMYSMYSMYLGLKN
jgi:hypothetical protein